MNRHQGTQTLNGSETRNKMAKNCGRNSPLALLLVTHNVVENISRDSRLLYTFRDGTRFQTTPISQQVKRMSDSLLPQVA